MTRNIYAIYDKVAEAIIGGLHLHAHAAPAVRMFSDVALMPDSLVARHPQDFDLIIVGALNDDNSITPIKGIVLSGESWQAAQQTPQPEGAPNVL